MAMSEVEKFGDHFPGDHCPDTVRLNGFLGFPKAIILTLVNNRDIDKTLELYKRYRFQALRRFSEEKRVKNYLSSFILTGGTQQEPLSTLFEPSVFDSNNYPTGTVIRILGLCHFFADQYNIQALWRIKDKGNQSFSNYRFVDANRMLAQSELLGVVSDSFTGSGNMFAYFGTKEEVIAQQKAAVFWQSGAQKLGEWTHTGYYDLRLLSRNFYIESFYKFTSIEVLEVGEKAEERVEAKLSYLSSVPTV